jgi:peptidylprolyl isomerase
MATGQNKHPENISEKKKWLTILVPAGGIAVLVLLVAMVGGGSGAGKMSDGSDGTADDPELKELTVGVKARDVKEGRGEPCPPGAKVKVYYKGWLTTGTVFDSSRNPGNPITFDLGGGIINGWKEGIPGMKPGGIRKLVIAPEKGYGSNPRPGGKIPPNATLIFEIELVEVSPGPPPRRSPLPTDLTKLSDGTAPNADDPGLQPLEEGLMYRDLKVGNGPLVGQESSVVVDYIGWRRSDGGLFDSSFKPDRTPLDANLTGGLIKGWLKGVPGMKVGGIRKLVIPPDLAYGNRAQGADIPANSTLVFEIEVLGMK